MSKVIVITGSNSGIGKETALELAKRGHTIVMVCRNEEKGKKAQEEIIKSTGNENIHLMLCDLSSFANVKRFCEEFKNKFGYLDVLINNAGVMTYEREVTKDDFELHFQVNYLSPFLLTNLLLDRIRPGGRIINLSSMAHRAGKIHFDDINLEKDFTMLKAYAQAKLAVILFTHYLAKQLIDKRITVNCVHPGVIISNLGIYNDRKVLRWLLQRLKWMFSSPKKGAKTPIYLADSNEVSNITGEYFYHKKVKKSSKLSYDEELEKKLWDKSLEWLAPWIR
ncbi:MAG: SDR family oxidoreductase [Bacilli bacterium]|nr:SDR family oxidoreductase [Bacilli bacterium]